LSKAAIVWGAQIRFSCRQAVFVEQPAESISTLDLVWSQGAGGSERRPLRIGRHEPERAVRPMAVVVVDEDAKHPLEVPPVEDQEPVETLRADGSDEALGDRVRLRCADRCLDDLDTFASKDRVEVTRELGVAIADQETNRHRSLGQCPSELAGLLGNPSAARLCGAAGEIHSPAAEFDEDEHVQPLEPDCLDGEEVDRDHALRLCP
jgi:hypothetical protein